MKERERKEIKEIERKENKQRRVMSKDKKDMKDEGKQEELERQRTLNRKRPKIERLCKICLKGHLFLLMSLGRDNWPWLVCEVGRSIRGCPG